MSEHYERSGKKYSSFSVEEEKTAVKEIIRTATSDDEIRHRMQTELCYVGLIPAISSVRFDNGYSVMIMFLGPDGRVINM